VTAALLLIGLGALAVGGILAFFPRGFRAGVVLQALGATAIGVAGFWVLGTGAVLGDGFTSAFAAQVGVDGLSGLFLGALGLVAAPALVPSLVSSRQLPAANARIELARTVAFASGPALGGVLVGWWGASPAFGFAAALSAVAVVLLSGIYEPARTPAPRRHPFQDIREGAAFVFYHPLLRPVFITQFIFNTGWFLQIAVFVPYAVRHLGLTAAGVGTVLTMYGVGMVIGALFATRVMKRIAFGTVIGLGPVTGFVAAVVMALTVLVPSPWLAGLSFFLLGVGPILWVISTTTLRQSVTPPRLLGRVSAINIMSYGARPLGSALGAIVGGFWSAEACLYLAAAVFGVQALVIWLSPAVALDRQPAMVDDNAAVRA